MTATDLLSLPPVPAPAPADHPWRDRALAALFALGLALPGVALVSTWKTSITRFENRAMAPWPAPALTRTFAPAFERAFADRFGGRDFLVDLHHTSLVLAFGVSPINTVIVGKDRWLYYNGDRLSPAREESPTSQTLNAAIVNGIRQRVDTLRKFGIDYLLVVVPDKQSIYPEFLPEGRSIPKTSRLDRVIAALPEELRAHVVDLRPALLDAKRERQIYFRTDSHWNSYGAWIASEVIGARLAALREPRKTLTWPAEKSGPSTRGDLASMLGVSIGFTEATAILTVPVCGRDAQGNRPQWGASKQTLFCNDAPPTTGVVYHDSMGHSLLPYLPDRFRESRWNYQRTWDLDELRSIAPHVVVEEIVERSLAQLADTWFLEPREGKLDVAAATALWLDNMPYPDGSKVSRSKRCSIDSVIPMTRDGLSELSVGGQLSISGWLDRLPAASPAFAWFVLQDNENTFRLRARTGLARPDVVESTRNLDLKNSGFIAGAGTEGLKRGRYQASIIWNDGEAWNRCDPQLQVELR